MVSWIILKPTENAVTKKLKNEVFTTMYTDLFLQKINEDSQQTTKTLLFLDDIQK